MELRVKKVPKRSTKSREIKEIKESPTQNKIVDDDVKLPNVKDVDAFISFMKRANKRREKLYLPNAYDESYIAKIEAKYGKKG